MSIMIPILYPKHTCTLQCFSSLNVCIPAQEHADLRCRVASATTFRFLGSHCHQRGKPMVLDAKNSIFQTNIRGLYWFLCILTCIFMFFRYFFSLHTWWKRQRAKLRMFLLGLLLFFGISFGKANCAFTGKTLVLSSITCIELLQTYMYYGYTVQRGKNNHTRNVILIRTCMHVC